MVRPFNTPRSYVVEVHSGQVKRSRCDLKQQAEEPSQISTAAIERRPGSNAEQEYHYIPQIVSHSVEKVRCDVILILQY